MRFTRHPHFPPAPCRASSSAAVLPWCSRTRHSRVLVRTHYGPVRSLLARSHHRRREVSRRRVGQEGAQEGLAEAVRRGRSQGPSLLRLGRHRPHRSPPREPAATDPPQPRHRRTGVWRETVSLCSWADSATPADIDLWWQSILRRYDLEHTFRLMEQTLGWTAPKIRHVDTADQWTWLVIAAHARLRPARLLTENLRRLWERRTEPRRLTPDRASASCSASWWRGARWPRCSAS